MATVRFALRSHSPAIRNFLSGSYERSELSRLIDKTRVTCLKWVPGTPKQFLSSHSSGQMYLYNEDAPCAPGAPAYQAFKHGQGYTVYTCKMKSSRNPMYRWNIGEGPINEFAFSPDHKLLATVSQDGFMRIFNYHSMELVGHMRSYFGGLLCVAWSPDGKYIVTGGEDDLVTVYSVQEKRIVCRGHGHRSWISQVAFDPYTTWLGEGVPGSAGVPVDLGSEEDLRPSSFGGSAFRAGGAGSWSFRSGMSSSGAGISGGTGVLRRGNKTSVSSASLGCVCYRFGSVGHDTQLCLWDLTEDVLKNPAGRHRSSTLFPQSPMAPNNLMGGGGQMGAEGPGTVSPTESASDNLSAATPLSSGGGGKKHKRGFSLTARLGGSSGSERGSGSGSKSNRGEQGGGEKESQKTATFKEDPSLRLLGTPVCPRLDEVPLIEPLICKKIAHERLTVLAFREDCIVTACQEGFICTWARPGKAGLSHQQSINSPNPGGSPNLLPGGTIV